MASNSVTVNVGGVSTSEKGTRLLVVVADLSEAFSRSLQSENSTQRVSRVLDAMFLFKWLNNTCYSCQFNSAWIPL